MAQSKGELTRGVILEAAITRFGREGFRATSVADICRDAGVSGTAAYAYFPNKEALFLAACDEDAAAVIREGLDHVTSSPGIDDWRDVLILTLVSAVQNHPLARRLLAGQEPEVTERVLELPALADLRKAVTERLRTEQLHGLIRSDIDPDQIGNGIIAVLLFSQGQLGDHFYVPFWVVIACQIAMALGTLIGGWRIVRTMGSKITRLTPMQGFCAEAGGSLTLFGATWLGIPVSTTHTITGAIIGVGAARKTSAVRWSVANNIVVAWIITIPASAAIAALFYGLAGLF